MSVLAVKRLGRVRYADGLEMQAALVKERQAGTVPDTLLLLEHEPVFTLGNSARRENVLLPAAELHARGFEIHETGRGGDVTYHGPGQLVAYPILSLAPDRCDIHRYLRDLEEVMIRTCHDYALRADRVPQRTGAWIGNRKVGAIGVRVARWVTSHGLALNVNTDLAPFRHIVPCGIQDAAVTSLAQELGRTVPMSEVMDFLTRHLSQVFGRSLV